MVIMMVYATALVGGQAALKADLLGPTAAIPIAFVCGLCIALIFVIMGRLMAETQDEFMRLLRTPHQKHEPTTPRGKRRRKDKQNGADPKADPAES